MFRKPVTAQPALVLAVLLTFSSISLAQPYIEVGFTGIAVDKGESTQMTVRVVFDTSERGSTLGGLTCFTAIGGTSIVDQSPDPFATQDPYTNEMTIRHLTSATLLYSPPSNSYIINTTDDRGELLSINVVKLREGFTQNEVMLPQNPEDFFPDTTQDDARIAIVSTPGYFVSGWVMSTGSFTGTGTFRFWAQTLEEAPSSTCPGDFDGNGVYDFADVSAFLTYFTIGCP